MLKSLSPEDNVKESNGKEFIKNRQSPKNCNIWNTPLFRQTFVLLGPLSLMLCAGVGLGTPTVMIPEIKSSNSTIQITRDVESWLYSIYGLATTPAVLTLPFLSQIKGYRFPFILMCFPILISFVLQYLATNATHLLLANILQGLSMGGNVTLGVIIVSEFPDPKYRGTFLFIKSASYFWGIWIANAIGAFSTWKNIPLFGVWPAVFALVSSFTWPESPYWLASKNKIEECKQAFRWVRGEGQDAENELALLTSAKPLQRSSKTNISFLKTTVSQRQFYMPFCLNIVMFFLYQCCGKYVCQAYVLVIIKNITQNDSIARTGMLIIDGVTVLGMYLGSYVATKVRRRTMYMSTTASTILFLYLFSAYLYLIEFKIVTQNNSIILGLFILYSFSVSWGPMVLCTSIFSEITPMRYKPFITSICVCFMFMMNTGFLKLAPRLFVNIGVNGTLSVYATLTLFSILFLYKYLPETKNRTLEEIELFFVQRSYSKEHEMESQEMLSLNKN